ncbi:MAG TPA: fibronectin type III domain-containing protein, partial [Candidatus Dormibacteraeota bacterium]
SSIVVTDLMGNILSTITGETGARAMVVVGPTLYVALSTGAIEKIDTASRTDGGALVTGLISPNALAYANGLLWTTTNLPGSVKLASIDMSAVTPSATTYDGIFNSTNGLSSCAAFATNHLANPSYLVAFSCGIASTINLIDVSGSTPVQTATASQIQTYSNRDVTVSADGSHVMVTFGYEVDEYNLATLALDGVVYPAAEPVVAVDTTTTNGPKVVGGLLETGFNSILAYPIGDPTQSLATASLGDVVTRGVAISPDGLTAYLLTTNFYGIWLNLQALPALAADGTPGPPTGVTAAVGVGAAVIGWTAPIYHGTSFITGYLVSSSGGATKTVGPDVFSTLMAGLSPVPHTFTVSTINSHGTGVPSAPSNAVTPVGGGTLNVLTPRRILDTRTGNGGFPIRRVSAGSALALQVLGRGAVPSVGVGAVVLNVTVTNTSGPGFVTAYPGGSRPNASNLNFARGQTVANLVQVAVGANGKVDLFVGGASADVIADVEGWIGDSTDSYFSNGLFNAYGPVRAWDSRQISTANGWVHRPLGPRQTLTLQPLWNPSIPSIGAVMLNITAIGARRAGYLTAYPAGGTLPLASNVNYSAGRAVPNRVIVGVGTNNSVSIYNGGGTVDVVVDLNGWFSGGAGGTGSALITGVPSRFWDTRKQGLRLGPGYVDDFRLNPSGITALSANVTATRPSAPSFLTLYPDDGSFGHGTPPTASDLNFVGGQTVANMTVVMIPSDFAFNVFNGTGSTDFIIDVDGVYGPVTERLVDTAGPGFVPERFKEPQAAPRAPSRYRSIQAPG